MENNTRIFTPLKKHRSKYLNDMIIFLVGFMGSGKSTLGKRLSKKISYDFIDMDEAIELEEGMTVSEIFELKGESHFRGLETRFLESLDSTSNFVIATGGGAPCFADNMRLMNEKGVTVYLKLTPANLSSRLENARSIRPLIAAIPPEELTDYIRERLAEREKYYNQARCVIKAENVKPDHVISLVFGSEE
jgi:shikimate kinase